MVEIGFRRVGNLKVVCNIHPGDSCIVQRDMQRVRQLFKCKSGISPRKVDNIIPVKELAETTVTDSEFIRIYQNGKIVHARLKCRCSGFCFGNNDIQITGYCFDEIQLVGINRFKIYIDAIEHNLNKYFVLKTILIYAKDSSEIIE